MSVTSDHPSSSEIAHEAEDARAELAHTLDQLRENLKPNHVVEEVVGNARIGASTIVDELYGLARQHPFPALLIGAGCAMILGVSGRVATQSSRHLPKVGRVRFIDSTLTPQPVDRGRPAGDPIVPGRSSIDMGRSTDTPSPVFAGSASTSALVSSRERSAMTSFSRTMPKSGREATSRLAGVLHEQPLILAALGVAVGAAIGASLPGTDVEDEWLGGPSSSVRHAAEDFAREEVDELRDAASRTADNLKKAASDRGFSGENLSGLVKDAGEQAKSALHDVGTRTTNG